MDIYEAARNGDVAFIKSYKGDVNVVDKWGWTALFEAACNGHTAAVKVLIEAKANVNVEDTNGKTALMLATRCGYMDVVTELKKAGAK